MAIIYGVLIIGSGYVGIWLKKWFDHKTNEFYKMKSYDKTIQSIVIGIIVFMMTIVSVQLPFELVSDPNKFVEFLMRTPSLFFLNIFYLCYVAWLWHRFGYFAKKRKLVLLGKYEIKLPVFA